MYLYLIQHAKAKSKEEDPERGLTEEGVAEAERVFSFLRSRPPNVEEVWHSGKRRAAQTADLLARSLGLGPVVSQRGGLSPNDDVRTVQKSLADWGKDTAIVGHMPHVSKLASVLLTGREDRTIVAFRNAGVVCLKREGAGWSLCWMITPEILVEP